MGIKKSPKTNTAYYRNLRYRNSNARTLELINCGLLLVFKERPFIGEDDPFTEKDANLILKELERLRTIREGREKYNAIKARKLAQFLQTVGTCTHDNRVKQAHGLCATCYSRWYKRVRQNEDNSSDPGSPRIDSTDYRDNEGERY